MATVAGLSSTIASLLAIAGLGLLAIDTLRGTVAGASAITSSLTEGAGEAGLAETLRSAGSCGPLVSGEGVRSSTLLSSSIAVGARSSLLLGGGGGLLAISGLLTKAGLTLATDDRRSLNRSSRFLRSERCFRCSLTSQLAWLTVAEGGCFGGRRASVCLLGALSTWDCTEALLGLAKAV